MSMTPAIAIHVTAALGALALGPVALWARRSRAQRPQLHRAAGYAWVTLMVITALSALFIRDGAPLPRWNGFSPIHLLVPVTLGSLVLAFVALARSNIRLHRGTMIGLYFGACVTAGVFTLLPDRMLGQMLWGDLLGLLPPGFANDHAAHARLQGTIRGILTGTPAWVWGLLAGLVVLGLAQTRERQAGIPRLVLLPVGMGIFSLGGLLSDFGTDPLLALAWAAPAAAVMAAITVRPIPQGVRFDAATRRFTLPGSWVPMLLILSIFLGKYAVGVSINMVPTLRFDTTFALAVALASGALTGVFAGRTARLLRLTVRPAPCPAYA